MPIWIAATIFAAFMQNLRFLLQHHLRKSALSTAGATWSRFLYSAPIVACGVILYARIRGFDLPQIQPQFWAYIVLGSLAQILATACVVALFGFRNFAIGVTLKKTETILTACLGLVVLGEGVSVWVFAAIVVGVIGVILISDGGQKGDGQTLLARFATKAAFFGLASGGLFGVSAVTYRGAILSLEAGDALLRSGFALAVACAIQASSLGLWIAWRERAQIGSVLHQWRIGLATGATSLLGSLGWFLAFGLQNAALVKAVGQVELVFTYLFSIFWLKERSTKKEVMGLVLILAALLAIILQEA
ncbi:MAG: DMT family transporter [Proteobacteria bacterium]|nr:DMT family transporter [Pseudomonadota bacterium]